MRARSVRFVVSAATAAVLVLAGLVGASSAAADPPPPDWQPYSTMTTPDGVTVTFETAISTNSVFDGGMFIDPALAYRPNIVNTSGQTRWFGFGSDLVTQGVVAPLWSATGWGAAHDMIAGLFWVELPAGSSLADNESDWYLGMPAWSGHTITIYELSGPGTTSGTPQPVEPTATALASVTTAAAD